MRKAVVRRFAQRIFIAGNGDKAVVGQLLVVDNIFMIGIRHNRIAMRLIDFFDFFRRKRAVGKGGVAMQICFIFRHIGK